MNAAHLAEGQPKRSTSDDTEILDDEDDKEWERVFESFEENVGGQLEEQVAGDEWYTLSSDDEDGQSLGCQRRKDCSHARCACEEVGSLNERSEEPLRHAKIIEKPHDLTPPRNIAAQPVGQENIVSVTRSGCPSKEAIQVPSCDRAVSEEQPAKLTFWQNGPIGKYWSYESYHDTKTKVPVKVIYCCDIVSSERAASALLTERVLGFDMEWKSNRASSPKDRVSLIQVACEDKIVLFHIARHSGTAVSELIAPSLRRLIEDSQITKTGVAISNADGRRLRQVFGLKPEGLFELSRLHRVVEYVNTKPELVNTKLIALSTLAHIHLGRPLFKGPVRTSDWRKPLTPAQIKYAASDAYVGFRLYHAMEAKRLKMEPKPSRPEFA